MVANRAEVDENWRDRAACRGMDTELFFPNVGNDGALSREQRARVAEAVKICETCPATVECWSYAKYFDVRHGIWGGVLLNRRGTPQSRMVI